MRTLYIINIHDSKEPPKSTKIDFHSIIFEKDLMNQ